MAGSPQHQTLTAATVATFTFSADYEQVEVYSVDGVAALYFSVDGSTPTVGGEGNFVIAAIVGGALQVATPVNNGGNAVVKVISSGIPKVSVRGV